MLELHAENYKILLNEVKEDLINGNTVRVHRLEDNTVKITIVPKMVYVFKIIYQNPNFFFLPETENYILKFIWHSKAPQLVKTILKQNKV